MKLCGESFNDLQKIEKVLRSLTVKFDYIIVSFEESKNLAEMKLEELQVLLEAREMRLK
jgi:predicted HTH domain antitoxin